MRTLIVSAAMLALLFLSGITSGVLLSSQCRAWEEQLTAAEDAATVEQWQTAQIQLTALQRSWDQHEGVLHSLLHRAEVDEAQVLLEQCRLFASLQDVDSLLSAGEQLRCQFRHLAETEELHLDNIL